MSRTENNAYRLLKEILFAVERNHERMREEPDSYGDTHDKWDDEESALNSLEESSPFLPRMLHPEYGTPESFVEDRCGSQLWAKA